MRAKWWVNPKWPAPTRQIAASALNPKTKGRLRKRKESKKVVHELCMNTYATNKKAPGYQGLLLSSRALVGSVVHPQKAG